MQNLVVLERKEYGSSKLKHEPKFVYHQANNEHSFEVANWLGWWLDSERGSMSKINSSTAIYGAGIARFFDPESGSRILFKIEEGKTLKELKRHNFLVPSIVLSAGFVLSVYFSLKLFLV